MMWCQVSPVIALILTITAAASAARNANKRNGGGSMNDEEKILRGLFKRYNNQEPPDTHNATQVNIFIHINRISKIDESNMAFTLDLHFKQQWFDKRLRFPTTSGTTEQMLRLSQENSANIWRPDTFFRNMIGASDFSLPNQQQLTFLYSSGRVYSSHRIDVTLYCPMMFHKFPFDRQLCPVTIETMANNMEQVVLKWSPLFAHAVELSKDLGLVNQKVDQVSLQDCNKQNNTAKSFSCIEFQLFLSRQLIVYIKHLFAPQLLLVCVSFISFFISTKAILARVTLLIVCAGTMVTHATLMTSRVAWLPEVPYYTGLDIWLTGNFAFLFLTLIEFAMAAGFPQKQWVPSEAPAGNSHFYMTDGEENGSPQQIEESLMENHLGSKRQKYVLSSSKQNKRGKRIDFMSRFIFPLAYIGFNVVYWVYYCVL